MILQHIEVRIQDDSFKPFMSPFINNGVISASFHWFGIFPCLMDALLVLQQNQIVHGVL